MMTEQRTIRNSSAEVLSLEPAPQTAHEPVHAPQRMLPEPSEATFQVMNVGLCLLQRQAVCAQFFGTTLQLLIAVNHFPVYACQFLMGKVQVVVAADHFLVAAGQLLVAEAQLLVAAANLLVTARQLL